MRLLIALLLTLQVLLAQAVEPKQKVEEYPVHEKAAKAAFGAEFMVHVVSSSGKNYFVPEYFTVELAVYPDKGITIPFALRDFTLRINGKKQELRPETPGIAALSLGFAGLPEQQRGASTPQEAVTAAGFNDTDVGQPVAGYLFFPFRGDGKKANTVELIYRGPAGEVTLHLR